MYYEALGITRDATDQEVRAAYRRAVRTAHPDACGTLEEFKRIRDAWAVLGDPEKRARFDAGLPSVTRTSAPAEPKRTTAPQQPKPTPQNTAASAVADAPPSTSASPDEREPNATVAPRWRRSLRGWAAALVAGVSGTTITVVLGNSGVVLAVVAAIYVIVTIAGLVGVYQGTGVGERVLAGAIGAAGILTLLCLVFAGVMWLQHMHTWWVPICWAAAVAVYAVSVTILGSQLRQGRRGADQP